MKSVPPGFYFKQKNYLIRAKGNVNKKTGQGTHHPVP
jgi:hypothetical protein